MIKDLLWLVALKKKKKKTCVTQLPGCSLRGQGAQEPTLGALRWAWNWANLGLENLTKVGHVQWLTGN